MSVEQQILRNAWFVVENGQHIDIHCRVDPQGEPSREVAVVNGAHSREVAEKIVEYHDIYRLVAWTTGTEK